VPPSEDLRRGGGGKACDPVEVAAGRSSSFDAGDIGRSGIVVVFGMYGGRTQLLRRQLFSSSKAGDGPHSRKRMD
jgi:hypothetical protein